jgi:hypothetical protein
LYTAQSELFRSKWTTFLKGVRSVCFVRVIICTRGWTGSQRAAVSSHNTQYPKQPILLADATARVAIFGEHSAEALREHVGDPQAEKSGKGTPKDNWVIPRAWGTANDGGDEDEQGGETKEQEGKATTATAKKSKKAKGKKTV